MTLSRACFFIALALTAWGCAGTEGPTGPNFARSELHAVEYPARVEALDAELKEGGETLDATIEAMKGYPDALSDPDWEVAAEVIRAADEGGRSESMHALLGRQEEVAGFIDEHLDDVSRRVGREVDVKAKKAGAKGLESRGTVRYALPVVLEKQFDEELIEAHPAHQLILARQDDLKEANVEPLQEQVDAITLSARYAFVELVEARAEADQNVTDAEQVKKTLDDAIAARRADAKREGISDSEAAYHAERLAALEAARGGLDAAVQRAKAQQKSLDEAVEKAQTRYQDALDALLKTLDERAEASRETQGDG